MQFPLLRYVGNQRRKTGDPNFAFIDVEGWENAKKRWRLRNTIFKLRMSVFEFKLFLMRRGLIKSVRT